MSPQEEYYWLLGILSDLLKYEEHNKNVIEQMIDIVKYRLECSNEQTAAKTV